MTNRWLRMLVPAAMLLRIWQFMTRGALWGDEAALALNIVSKPFRELGRPFIDDQVAPYLFVVLEKVVARVLGESEHVLRGSSLLAGLCMLPLCIQLAARVAGTRAALLTAALMLSAHHLVYFATELKPYALDACLAALLWLLGHAAGRASSRTTELHRLGALGVVVPWLSLPSVFVLAGVGSALALDAALQLRDRRRAVLICGYCSLWLASFTVHYWLFLRAFSNDPAMRVYFTQLGDYAPAAQGPLATLRWYFGRFFYLFDSPGDFPLRYLAGLAFCGGALLLLVRDRWLATMFFVPWLAVFGASAARHYVIETRIMLFIVPSMYVAIASAFAWLTQRRERVLQTLGVALGAALCLGTLPAMWQDLRHGVDGPDARDLAATLAHDYRAGDRLFVDEQTGWTYDFYARRVGIEHAAGVLHAPRPQDDPEGYRNMLRSLLGVRRAWVLLPSTYGIPPHSSAALSIIERDEQETVRFLDQSGRQLARHDGGNMRLYLYDLYPRRF